MKKYTNYPKIFGLLITYIIIFFIFSFAKDMFEFILENSSYIGIFFSGMLYTYSFTGGIGMASFLILNNYYSPIVLSLIGGVGASIADITILKFLQKFNFEDELNLLSKENNFKLLRFKILKNKIFLTLLGVITIASPLPDELGVLFISKGKILSLKYLFFIGLIANTIGIYLITNI
jgi:hypothetical protein